MKTPSIRDILKRKSTDVDLNPEFDSRPKLLAASAQALDIAKDKPSVGLRYNHNKPRVDLVPYEFILAAARAFTHGAKKYSAHNWRNGLTHDQLMGSVLRHAFEYNEGVDIDKESGLSTLDHLAASVAMLVALNKSNRELAQQGRYKKDSNPVLDTAPKLE